MPTPCYKPANKFPLAFAVLDYWTITEDEMEFSIFGGVYALEIKRWIIKENGIRLHGRANPIPSFNGPAERF